MLLALNASQMLSDTGALLGICITNNTQELQEGVSHHSVLLNERMSPNANLLIEETRRDSQSKKLHFITGVKNVRQLVRTVSSIQSISHQ